MPVAVLCILTLGLAVDFAIHFLARVAVALRGARLVEGDGAPRSSASRRAPSRATSSSSRRASCRCCSRRWCRTRRSACSWRSSCWSSGVATLLLLPALVRVLEGRLFARSTSRSGWRATAARADRRPSSLVVVVALNLHQYLAIGLDPLTWVCVVAIPVLALACGIMSRRAKCRRSARTTAVSAGGDRPMAKYIDDESPQRPSPPALAQAAFAAGKRASAARSRGPDRSTEIVDKTNHVAYYQGTDGGRGAMTITDARAATSASASSPSSVRRRRAGPSVAKTDQTYAGDQKFYVYFTRPADVQQDGLPGLEAPERRTTTAGSTCRRSTWSSASPPPTSAPASSARTSSTRTSPAGTSTPTRTSCVETTTNYYVLKNTPEGARHRRVRLLQDVDPQGDLPAGQDRILRQAGQRVPHLHG